MKKILIPILGSILLFQCGEEVKKERNEILVSIAPQRFIVKRIVGEHFPVRALLPLGASPATFSLSPRELDFSDAFLYFTIGVPFEQTWMSRIQGVNQHLSVVDSAQKIVKLASPSLAMILEGENHEGKDHHHAHHHEGMDPHVWTSPGLVKIQAKTIKNELVKRFPEKTKEFSKNHTAFIKELSLLQEKINTRLKLAEVKNFMVFHPAWGYFAKEFGLRQIPIEIEGKEPSGKALEKLIRFAKEKDITAIFIQPQFSRKVAQAIANEVGAKIITIDPLSENYIQNLTEVVNKIAGQK